MSRQTHKVKIEGKEYTFQRLPVMEGLKLRERCRTQGDLDTIRFYTELLEHIVISPKGGIEAFETNYELEEVMKAVIDFQYGKGK